tara:strand:+ start:133 stop:564 length:432 start_codon:yes stop_codon:yes gene_type:complete
MKMFQTSEDRVNEEIVAKALQKRFGGDFKKLPYTYGLDYLWTRDKKPDRWIEIKKMNNASNEHEQFMFSLHKIQCANTLYESTALKSFLVVWWQDRLGITQISNLVNGEDFRLGYYGRPDRQDEPQVYIDQEKFKTIEVRLGD